ncbi:DUF1648 domain-containing protein [Bacillus sp. FJAT-50079]|uniref:DUF1648 domain-containing protein n=1 Tax=Bacillus sp. FJAT-50079 TaxID=2833577 RepID=UPI001BCA3C01|nr:DUF1648 domain-containing protein [Bacillus sp. FJAT-50079]MBS4206492.1 DUF1648 domain-containing protein [Bacillus sp. FJAT-50079]
MVYFIILLMFIPTIFISAITPYITRKTESFGVSIPEEVYEQEELVDFRRKYAWQTAIFGLITLLLSLTSGLLVKEEQWMFLFMSFFFLFLFGSFFIYLNYHKKMKQMKANSKWEQAKTATVVIDTNFRNRKLIHSHGWFAIAIIITVVTFAVTVMYYDRIPAQIPMQYGFDGEVTNWAEKSFGSVFSLPLIQLFMVGLFVFINYTIGRSRQQIDAANPEKSMMQNMIFRQRWSAFLIFTGTATVALLAAIQLSLIFPLNVKIIMYGSFLLTGLVLVGAIALSIITGQGGSRVKTVMGKQGEMISRDEDQFWKLGIFYFNRNDPAVWVEKRFGSGWTVNMAKPQAWVFFIIILAIPICISLFS